MSREDQAISDADIGSFREVGAVVLKGILSEAQLALLESGFEEVAGLVENTGEARDGRRNLMKEGTARISAQVARFLRESPAGKVAAAAMGSRAVRLYEDLLFVKEVGDGQPTPWHQDSPHWPVKGAQLSSFWVSLEPTTHATGAMAMVPGSHRQPLFTPNGSSVPEAYLPLVVPEAGGPLPEPGAIAERYPIRFFETARGDAVLFHPSMLHSAPGIPRDAPRRTFTFRFLGDDVRWFHRDIVMQEHIRALPLKDGDPVTAPCFAIVWPPEERTI